MTANVLGDGGGTVQGQEDGGLQLGLGTLNLGGGNVAAQARPLAEGEVDQVIEVGQVLGNQVDTPETGKEVSMRDGFTTFRKAEKLTQCRCSWWRNS